MLNWQANEKNKQKIDMYMSYNFKWAYTKFLNGINEQNSVLNWNKYGVIFSMQR